MENKNSDQRLERVEKKVDHLDQRVERVEKKVDKLEQKVDHLDQRVERVEKKVDKLEQKVDHLDQKVDKLEQKVDKVQDTLTFIVGYMKEQSAENQRIIGVMEEKSVSYIEALGEGVRANRERLDTHGKRLDQLEAS